MNKPGIKSKPFLIYFSENWYKKGDILVTGQGIELKVIKVYKLTWWKKILIKLGFRFRIKGIKVKCL